MDRPIGRVATCRPFHKEQVQSVCQFNPRTPGLCQTFEPPQPKNSPEFGRLVAKFKKGDLMQR
jgi:hypothetical protein